MLATANQTLHDSAGRCVGTNHLAPPAAEGGQLWVAADSSILLLRIQLHSGGANEVQPEA